jgi:hypothetical protein
MPHILEFKAYEQPLECDAVVVRPSATTCGVLMWVMCKAVVEQSCKLMQREQCCVSACLVNQCETSSRTFSSRLRDVVLSGVGKASEFRHVDGCRRGAVHSVVAGREVRGLLWICWICALWVLELKWQLTTGYAGAGVNV